MTIQKLTKEFLLSRIADARYVQHEGTTLTHCLLTMKNGIVVDGKSACLNPADFDAEMGRKIAYDNAFAKLWELEGYARASEHAKEPAVVLTVKAGTPAFDVQEVVSAIRTGGHVVVPEGVQVEVLKEGQAKSAPAVRIIHNPGRTLSEVAYLDALGVRVPVGEGFTVGVVGSTDARARSMQREFFEAAARAGLAPLVDAYSRLVTLGSGCTVQFFSGPYIVSRMGGMDFSHIVGDLSSLTAEEREFVANRVRLVPPPVNCTAEFLREAVKRKPSLDLSGLAGKMGGAA